MANESIIAIEDAIMALLEPLRVGQPGGYLNTLETYEGEFHQAVEKIVVRPPAALVMYAKAVHVARDADELQAWMVLLGDSRLRSERASRHGGAAGQGVIGTYRMLRDVRTRLDRIRPLPDVGPLLWLGEESVAAHPTWSIYAAHYQARITYQP